MAPPAPLCFDAGSAACVVYTWADGLLSAFAHDLAIGVGAFTLDVDAASGAISARFDAASLRVIGAMRSGAATPTPLADRDRAEIELPIRGPILAADGHPAITFASSRVTLMGRDMAIEGTLTIRGRAGAITSVARPADGGLVAEATIHTPDFGIAPFKAMLGTLRVKPDVRVRLSVRIASAASAA